MANDNGYYNFLPPFLQAYPNNPESLGQQEDITRLNQYLPSYNTTVGYLTALEVNGSDVPTNLVGASGPAGSTGGLSYSPPATPFMMISYGQTVNGLIQFALMNGDVLPLSPPDVNGTIATPDPTQYFFVSASDIIDFSRVTQVFYRQVGTPGNNVYKFYDANLVRQNPTQPVTNYELFAQCDSNWESNYNTFATWPLKYFAPGMGSDSSGTLTSVEIQFIQNYNSTELSYLGAGSIYNIRNIALNFADGSSSDGYITYPSDGDFTGYGPGYPVNFNYAYTSNNKSIITYTPNTDLIQNDSGQAWPGQVNINVYNSSVANIKNYIQANDTSNNFIGFLDLFSSGSGGFLNCSCSNNNECSSSDNTYYNNNCNTVQAGIMQYLAYQFVPFQQLKTPLNSIVTDFRNTEYSYVTLPEETEFTPQGYKFNNFGQTGPTGPFGSFPVEIQQLIDGSTGATGFTTSRSSIISGWMNNPLNPLYSCSISNATNSYCGFLEYYDSLFGIPYDYTNECTGMHKGPCPSGGYCVPNFQFLTTYNVDDFSPFICVTPQEGITTQNLNYYIGSLPANTQNINNITFPAYEPANPGPAPPKSGNQPSKQASNLFFYIGIAVALIVLIVVIWLIVKVARNKPEYKSYTRVVPQEPNLNPLNINAL